MHKIHKVRFDSHRRSPAVRSGRRAWVTFLLGLCCTANSWAQAWTILGPDGGDARSISFDPRNPARVFLGTGTGTVFLSANGGDSWSRLAQLGDGADYVLDHIAVDQQNPDIIFVSAWSSQNRKDGALFRSRDGGSTWQVLPALRGKSIRALAIAASDPKVIIVGCLDGIYRSRDGGEQWERMSPAGHAELKNIESLAIDPKRPDTVYAGTWHLPWKTSDGGQSWHRLDRGIVDDSDVFSIIVDSTNSLTVFASACSGIYKSENAGELFHKIQGIPFSSRRTRVLKQDPVNPNIIYAGTTEGLWRTSDAGKIWKQVSSPDRVVNDILVDPRNSRHVLLATDRSGVLVSEDGARTFTTANRGYSHRLVTAILVDRNDPEVVFVAVANDREWGGVFSFRRDTGIWQQACAGLQGRDVYTLAQTRDGVLVAGTNRGIFMLGRRSQSWRATKTMLNSQQPPIREVALGETLRSSSERLAIQPLLESKVNEIDAGNGRWLAATSDGLYVSSDQGEIWSGGPVLGRRDFVSVRSSGRLEVAATRTEVLIANGLKDWEVSSLPSYVSGIRQVVITPDGVVLVVYRAGVLRSSDEGATWQAPLHGLDKEIGSISYDDERHRLLATSRGAGIIFESTDSGRTWQQGGDAGYPLRSVSVMHGHLVGATLFDGVAVEH